MIILLINDVQLILNITIILDDEGCSDGAYGQRTRGIVSKERGRRGMEVWRENSYVDSVQSEE